MGEVYLAEHKYIARKAAIKFLLRDLSNSSELVGRFFAEARAASVIKHPGIVEVLDCDVHDGRAYIVMELLRGESLRDYIERVGSVGRDELGALGIFRQIASALAAAHAQEIIHRDLKPDNVFLHVSEEGSPTQPIAKVLDFGIAKLMGRGEGGTKTRTGQLLGTPMYMSPEQCRGVKQIDNRSDIYSLGCIMYEVFCGNAPFLDEGFGDLIIAHVSRPPPEPLHAAPWMSAPSRRLLLDCLAKDPADRPQSMRDVMARLSQLHPSEEIALQVPVSVERRTRAGGTPDGRISGSRSGQRLAQTTPMPASAAISSSGSTLTAPLEEPMMQPRSPSGGFAQQRPVHAPGAITTPSGAGRTRVLLPEDTVPGRPGRESPSTLSDGAVERFKTAPRTRGAGSKIAIGFASVAAIALAALVIIRAVTPPPVAGDKDTTVQNDSPGNSATGTTTTSGTAAGETERVPHTQPPPPAAISVITLLGLPPDALVRLDGHAVTPPVSVPREPETHHLIIDANGYQRWETSFDARSDRTVAVEMKRLAAPPPVRAATPRPHRRGGDKPPKDQPGFDGFTDL
jgi:serine/threonine protein kinase